MLSIVYASKMHDAVSRIACLLAPLLCMLDVFCVIWYVHVAVCLIWKGLTSLLTSVILASTVATLGNLIPYALRIRWRPCGRIYLIRVLWCLNRRATGSVYLLPSLRRSRPYLRCIWRWSSRSVTTTLRIGQPTVGKRMRLSSRALRSFWTSLNLPIRRYLLSRRIQSPKTVCRSPSH